MTPPKLKPVSRQVIVITGASSGIGLATAQEAARRGAKVVLSARDEHELERAAASIREAGGQVAYAVGDVADFEAMKRLADTAMRAFGRIDTWINNAGVSIHGQIVDVTLDAARRLFETNYWGVVNGSLVARYHLASEGGALINIGSPIGESGHALQGHYAASKYAVKGFTDSLRLELEKSSDPIAVTLVELDSSDTPLANATQSAGVESKLERAVNTPEMVARTIVDCAQRPQRTVRIGPAAGLFAFVDEMPEAILLGAAAVGVGLGIAARRLFGDRTDPPDPT
jgi:short-subunit dehydrogenase